MIEYRNATGLSKKYTRRVEVCADTFVQIRDASEDLTRGLQSVELPEQFLGPVSDNAEREKSLLLIVQHFSS